MLLQLLTRGFCFNPFNLSICQSVRFFLSSLMAAILRIGRRAHSRSLARSLAGKGEKSRSEQRTKERTNAGRKPRGDYGQLTSDERLRPQRPPRLRSEAYQLFIRALSPKPYDQYPSPAAHSASSLIAIFSPNLIPHSQNILSVMLRVLIRGTFHSVSP